MRKPSEWGGGPEIVVLANVLRRPIHVYELQACSADDDDDNDDDGMDATTAGAERKSGVSSGGHSSTNGFFRRVMNLRLGRGGATAITARGGAFASSSGPRVPRGEVTVAPSGWRLRRIACFGSPKFDRANAAVHILSADSRFPDLKPGDQLPNGNHFLALFPVDTGGDRKTRNNLRSSSGSSSGRGAHEYSAAFEAEEREASTSGAPFRVFAFWRWPFGARRGNGGSVPSSVTNNEMEEGRDTSMGTGGLSGAGAAGENSSVGVPLFKQLNDIVRRAAGMFTGPPEKGAVVS